MWLHIRSYEQEEYGSILRNATLLQFRKYRQLWHPWQPDSNSNPKLSHTYAKVSSVVSILLSLEMTEHDNKYENNSCLLSIYDMLSTVLSDLYVLMVVRILATFQSPAKSPHPEELIHQSGKLKEMSPLLLQGEGV